MTAIERRALYNLLRMNWLHERNLSVEPWQVEDYHSLPLTTLFDQLSTFNIALDRVSFIAFADECDSPEDFTEHLIADRSLQTAEEDQVYLLIFELWRRLMSEKPSLSILCNDLDEQIYLYDNQQLENPFALQDAITNFVYILDENVDQGVEPDQAFRLISPFCANDVETFLYDFIAEQIDEENETYALELLDDFDPYLGDDKWFKLLWLRHYTKIRSKSAQKIAQEVIEEYIEEDDLDFNLEFLSMNAELGDHSVLRKVINKTLPLLKNEEEFQDLLSITIGYYQLADEEQQETVLNSMLEKRKKFPSDKPLSPDDPDLATFSELLNST